MTKLEQYYNKFHEENRLKTRHGIVEFSTSMNYIKKYALQKANCKNGASSYKSNTNKDVFNAEFNPAAVKIADIGAGTGRYSVELCRLGFDVTAVELVKHNLEILRSKHENIKTWQGDARNLNFLEDNIFDITLLFGPMYHLHGDENKMQALNEAKRITKKDGFIFVAYVMNEYSVISYCFKEHKFAEVKKKGGLTNDFHTICKEDDLYDYVRIEDINRINKKSNLKRELIFAPDGAADYMRRELNEMSQEEFSEFLKYQLSVCEKQELLGASSHLVDILKK